MVLKSFQSFGRVDAESELGLPDFFVETPAYQDIENGQKLVVTGRKGAGKTAIYATLLDRADRLWENVYASGVVFRDYPWDLHDAAAAGGGDATAERYAALWELLILRELSKLVLQADHAHGPRRARRRLRRFVTRNWGSVSSDARQTFARSSYKLVLEPKFMGVSLGSFQRDRVTREQLAARLPEVNQWLRRQLQMLLHPDALYFVLFDDLDGGYRADEPAAHARLIGLLIAAREIRIWADSGELPMTPVIFLRSDIYAVLHFSNKNKIASDLLERIVWSDKESDHASLKNLLVERIQATIGTGVAEPWEALFENETLGGASLYESMASLTHLRPRDMIFLANKCLAKAKDAEAPRIGAYHISAAVPAYSDYLLGEIADEANQAEAEWERCLMTLRRVGQAEFDRDTFISTAGQDEKAADQSLRALYAHGVIGYRQRDAVIYAYRDEVPLDLDAGSFIVHPGLCAALSVATRQGGDTDPAA